MHVYENPVQLNAVQSNQTANRPDLHRPKLGKIYKGLVSKRLFVTVVGALMLLIILGFIGTYVMISDFRNAYSITLASPNQQPNTSSAGITVASPTGSCRETANTCLNNGKCMYDGIGYSCMCNVWYNGKRCETVQKNHLVVHKLLNWNDGRLHCQSLGGDLATWGMRNSTVRNWVVDNLLKPISNDSTTYWIGLTDQHSEGNWTYVDGVAMTTKNTNFYPGEPNNHGRYGAAANCGQIWAEVGYKMDDETCNRTKVSICERR